jgi:hypothetical protein
MTKKCNPLAGLLLIILTFVVAMSLNEAGARASGAAGLGLKTPRAASAAHRVGAGAAENASAVKSKSMCVLKGLVLNVDANKLSSTSLNLLDA